jgi:beta-lactamase class A
LFAQPHLQQKIAAVAADAHGKVSVACSLPGAALNCDLNPHAHPPMQSVFKAPLALAALHLVERGVLSLDKPVRFRASDRIPGAYSPLQDQYPAGDVDVPLRRLLSMAVSLSDNGAADVVLRVIGGPSVVDRYIQAIGISGFHLEDNEATLHRDRAAQYRNWFEPAAAVEFLRLLNDHPPLTAEHAGLLLGWMRETPRGSQRIGGQLPAGTVVMHKPGTSDTDHGLTPATNDIGLITLPDGRRLAIAIFVTDSTAGESTRDLVIARIARAAYDGAIEDDKKK